MILVRFGFILCSRPQTDRHSQRVPILAEGVAGNVRVEMTFLLPRVATRIKIEIAWKVDVPAQAQLAEGLGCDHQVGRFHGRWESLGRRGR